MNEKFKSISELFGHAERQTHFTMLVGSVKPCEDDELTSCSRPRIARLG
jgi:hypothetical protein